MITPRLYIAAYIFCMLLVSIAAHAKDTLQLYFEPLAPLISSDGKSGHLIDILKEIELRSGIQINTQILPQKRSLRKIVLNEPVAWAPYLTQTRNTLPRHSFQSSLPLAFRISLVWARNGIKPPRTIASLQTHVMVTANFASLPPPLNTYTHLRIINTEDIKSAVHLLKKGRADIFINDYVTTMAEIENQNAYNISYDPTGLRFVEPASIIYANSVQQHIVKKVDQAILSMVKDDTFLKILPQGFVEDYTPYLPK